MEEQKKMKISRKDNWIVKVSKGTVTVYGEGREKAVTQALSDFLGLWQMSSAEQAGEMLDGAVVRVMMSPMSMAPVWFQQGVMWVEFVSISCLVPLGTLLFLHPKNSNISKFQFHQYRGLASMKKPRVTWLPNKILKFIFKKMK